MPYLQTKMLMDSAYIASGVALTQTMAYANSIYNTKLVLGLDIPHWVGWVMFFIALSFGATLSVHQDTAVDKYIKHPKLKPFYSLGFGFFVAVFGIPMKYPDVTVFDLILPAIGLAAIGSQIIYYLIALFTAPELWDMVKSRVLAMVKGGSK